jgi:hypothetical protein
MLDRYSLAELIGFAGRLDPGLTAQDFVDAGMQLDRIADERREVGSWSTPSPLSRSLAPPADRFGQLAYVTFVHEPLLQSTGVP